MLYQYFRFHGYFKQKNSNHRKRIRWFRFQKSMINHRFFIFCLLDSGSKCLTNFKFNLNFYVLIYLIRMIISILKNIQLNQSVFLILIKTQLIRIFFIKNKIRRYISYYRTHQNWFLYIQQKHKSYISRWEWQVFA